MKHVLVRRVVSHPPALVAVTDSEGCYVFSNVLEGSYRLSASPPAGLSIVNATDEDGWLIINDSVDIVFCPEGVSHLDGTDIVLSPSD